MFITYNKLLIHPRMVQDPQIIEAIKCKKHNRKNGFIHSLRDQVTFIAQIKHLLPILREFVSIGLRSSSLSIIPAPG